MKSEVKALEWAVSALVAKLDMLLTCEIGLTGMLDASHGLRISTPDHLHVGSDAFVTIRPIGWPDEARIDTRFYRSAPGWKMIEGGMIANPNLPRGIDRIRFKPSDDPIGVRLDPFNDHHTSFAKAGYRYLIKVLRQDLQQIRK